MPLRQTQGFLTSLKNLLGLTIRVPHYSTFARRASGLDVPRPAPASAGGPVHLAIDSTGLKVFGEGEGKIRLHGKDKRRVWRKLHLAVDTTTGEILAHALTVNARHDGPELPGLLARVDVPVAAVYADKAYDAPANHAAILAREARPVIPPRKGAAISPPRGVNDPPQTRGDAVRRMAETGRRAWKTETGYHKRSLSEAAMFRFRTIIGPNRKPRALDNQKTEAAVAVRCLNSFTACGMPASVNVA